VDFSPSPAIAKILQQIQDAALDPSQVKELESLVSLGGKENVFGFLTKYVEMQSHLSDFFPLKPRLRPATKATREKWANQLERGIQLLHSARVVWGNVNPSNIVIDQDGGL
jgi:serine/threonine protein kinase